MTQQPLPPTPRPLTRLALKRSWAEPTVRFWLLVAFVLSLVCLYLLLVQTWRWSRERRLIWHGIPVSATVVEAGGEPVVGKQMPPTSSVRLRFERDGQTVELTGYLAGRKEYIEVGAPIPIRVDPEDPKRWTARTEPTPLARHLVGGLLVLPAAALALLVAWIRRRKVLRVWRDGTALPVKVIELQQSALAPRSWAVRCAAEDPKDQRIYAAYVPRSLADLRRGEVLWIVRPPKAAAPALAAVAFAPEAAGGNETTSA